MICMRREAPKLEVFDSLMLLGFREGKAKTLVLLFRLPELT